VNGCDGQTDGLELVSKFDSVVFSFARSVFVAFGVCFGAEGVFR